MTKDHEQDPVKQEFINLYAEGFTLPQEEKGPHFDGVTELVVEQFGSDVVASQLKRTAFIAFKSAQDTHASFDASLNPTTYTTTVDMSLLGWSNENEPKEVPLEKIGTVPARDNPNRERNLLFADLTDCSNPTQLTIDKLKEQRDSAGDVVADKLLAQLKSRGVAKLYTDVTSGGRSVRPVNVGNSRSSTDRFVDTTLPAYKIDVLSTANRAILLILDDNSDSVTIGLAALYDHDDDGYIHRNLSP